MDKIWKLHPIKYSEINNESRKYILFPKLKEIIKKNKPSHIFDYGGGDGSLEEILNTNYKIGFYDVSKKAVTLAKKKNLSNMTFFNSKSSIPSNKYDLVIFSLVLMTITSKNTINSTLKEIKRIKKKWGKLIVAITHPCFKIQKFGSFYTDIQQRDDFNYFSEGGKYLVTLFDPISKRKLKFYDYHWSLSFTVNALIKNNFRIVEMIELKDMPRGNKYHNKKFPPYLVIICE